MARTKVARTPVRTQPWTERRRRSDLETVAMLVAEHGVAQDNRNLERELAVANNKVYAREQEAATLADMLAQAYEDIRRLTNEARRVVAYCRHLEAALGFPLRPRNLLPAFEAVAEESETESEPEIIDLT